MRGLDVLSEGGGHAPPWKLSQLSKAIKSILTGSVLVAGNAVDMGRRTTVSGAGQTSLAVGLQIHHFQVYIHSVESSICSSL